MFSVIIPLYNKEASIQNTVENAIIAFSEFKYEIIIVNDGSTDNSLYIAKQLAEKNFNITVISKDNGGVSSARNAGIDNSKYEYVVFLDADDTLLAHAGNEFFKLINATDDSVGMYCLAYEFLLGDKTYGFNSLKYLKDASFFGIVNNPLKVLCRDKNSIFMCASSICVRKSMLVKFNIKFPLGVTHTEDSSFFYDLIINSNIAYSSKVSAVYQLDASNRSNLSKPTSSRYIIEKIIKYINVNHLDSERKYWSLSFVAKNYIHLLFNCIEAGDYLQFNKNKKKTFKYFKYMTLYYKLVFVFFVISPFYLLTKVVGKNG